jgi:hypothetical protein
MSTERIEKNFEIELPDGETFTLSAEATKVVDPNYGADADNRRGERREYIEDVKVDPREWDRFKAAVSEALEAADWEN